MYIDYKKWNVMLNFLCKLSCGNKFCTESDDCLYALYLIFKLHFCSNNFADSIICISLYGLANIVSYVPGRLLLTDYFIY